MKRVNAITRCKGIIAEKLDRKAARILRQVNQALDAAEDELANLSEKEEDLINSLGSVAGSEQTSELQAKINAYIDLRADINGYKDSVAALKDLKAKLEAEVELTEDEDGATIIKEKK